MKTFLLAGALLGGMSAPPAFAACVDLLRDAVEAVPGEVNTLDLARLRDIGQPGDRLDLPSPLGLAPDRDRVAFVLRRAAPEINAYCQALVLLDLSKDKPRPLLLDGGGDLIRERYPLFGHELPESGVPRVITPRWSPDGRRVAYLKRTDGKAQIWIVDAAGSGAAPATSAPAGVEDFAWSADGKSLVYASRPDLIEAEAGIEAEALQGYLVDKRFRPLTGRRPFPRADTITTRYFMLRLAEGTPRPASDIERALLAPTNADLPAGAAKVARGRGGRVAWTMAVAGDPLARRLAGRIDGKERDCMACRGEIADLWWGEDGALYYLTREGAQRSRTGFYRWRPDKEALPDQIVSSEDLVLGCRPAKGADTICLAEGSLVPRHLIRIDGKRKRIEPIWDPNPRFATAAAGTVSRLRWTNDFGIATFGDLVLPPGHRPGEKHPLVIVQYGSRGFLRGGTGDEYPILALAAHGFAVLSFQRPLHWSIAAAARGLGEVNDSLDQVDRRSVQSALERGIALAVASGAVDPTRIGITGLSDGATTLAWALTHGGGFKAAAMSSCCLDPGLMPLLGEAQVEALAQDGFPPPGRADASFWRDASFAANAAKVEAPVLMQLADDEYLGALESYWALKGAGLPVEMLMFPGEHHIKFQPAHRLAIYRRNLQWFDFWLRDVENPAPELAGQYARWRAMRDDWLKQKQAPHR